MVAESPVVRSESLEVETLVLAVHGALPSEIRIVVVLTVRVLTYAGHGIRSPRNVEYRKTAQLVVDQAHRIHRRTADADRKTFDRFAEIVLQFQRQIQVTIEHGTISPVGYFTQRVIRIAGRTAQRAVGVHQRILLRRSAHDGVENTRRVVVVPTRETAAVDPTAHVDLCGEVLGNVDIQVASQVEAVHAYLRRIVVQIGIIEHTAVVHVASRHHIPHGFRTAADIDADVRDQSRLLEQLVEVVVVGMRVLIHSALAVIREVGDRVVHDRQAVVGTRLIIQYGVLVRIQQIGLVGKLLPSDIDVHVDRRLSDKTALGRYQQNSVGGLLSVQSNRSRVLQNRYAFDLIQGKLIVFRSETIDDHQRRIHASVGIETPDVNAGLVTRLVRAFLNDQTGQTADQGFAYRSRR